MLLFLNHFPSASSKYSYEGKIGYDFIVLRKMTLIFYEDLFLRNRRIRFSKSKNLHVEISF